jgi:hypothetical protein
MQIGADGVDVKLKNPETYLCAFVGVAVSFPNNFFSSHAIHRPQHHEVLYCLRFGPGGFGQCFRPGSFG